MKFAILILDGASDLPLDELGGGTPLAAARCPNLDWLAARGRGGRARFIPHSLPPGSDVAILSIAGYDPVEYYCGRGPLEALAQGLAVEPDQTVYRCNLITADQGLIRDYSAGHIRSADSHRIIADLGRELGSDRVRLHPGVDYRHILIMDGHAEPECFAPHDHMDEPMSDYMPTGSGSERLIELMNRAAELLREHPVNLERRARGDLPATHIWPWGGGRLRPLGSYADRFGITGAVITAVDLVRGIGRAVGLDIVDVPGATGLWDTNYEGKAEAAIDALRRRDLVLVHVEAADEAGHAGRADLKIRAIEDFDAKVLGPMLEFLRGGEQPWRLLVAVDHPTPIQVRTHTRDWAPFALAGTGIERHNGYAAFDENLTREGNWSFPDGHLLIETLIGLEGPAGR